MTLQELLEGKEVDWRSNMKERLVVPGTAKVYFILGNDVEPVELAECASRVLGSAEESLGGQVVVEGDRAMVWKK